MQRFDFRVLRILTNGNDSICFVRYNIKYVYTNIRLWNYKDPMNKVNEAKMHLT